MLRQWHADKDSTNRDSDLGSIFDQYLPRKQLNRDHVGVLPEMCDTMLPLPLDLLRGVTISDLPLCFCDEEKTRPFELASLRFLGDTDV